MVRSVRTVLHLTLSLLSTFPVAANAQQASLDKVLMALPKLEANVQKLIEDGAVPGVSIAIVFRDEALYLKGFGIREEGQPDPVDADTVFQLASLSKAISSTVVAKIVTTAPQNGTPALPISIRPSSCSSPIRRNT